MEEFKWLRPYGRQFGDGRREGPWHVGHRHLLDFLLVYVKEGRGVMKIKEKQYIINAGDLFWVPPNVSHEMWGEAPFMDLAYVHFDLIYRPGGSDWDFTVPAGTQDLKSFGSMLHPPLPPGPLAELSGKIQTYHSAKIGQLISSMASEALASRPHHEFKISGLLMEMVGEILTGRQGPSEKGNQAYSLRLEKASDYLSQGEDSPTVEKAASISGLSTSHFRKLFQTQYGCTPKAWMMRSRLAKAKQLMGNPLLNFTQISLACGFSTVHNFSRAFSQSEGMSPRQYRQFGGQHFQVETSQGVVPSRRFPSS